MFKTKKKGAQQGHSLLKKKSDALTARFRAMLREIAIVKKSVGEELREAAYSVAKANYGGGNYHATLLQTVKRPAITLKIVPENVAGVKLPVFETEVDRSVDILGNLGIAGGHQLLQSARERFLRSLSLLVKLASIQTSFFTLDEEIKMTNRRVNALDNVVIPALEFNINYITKELDEQEREEFFRLKKIQGKKKEKIEQDELQEKEHRRGAKPMSEPQSIFDQTDKDIIF